MHLFSTPAIVIRRIQHGDSDLIITFLTLEKGKVSLIAKAAKKSKRRFAGILELFSTLHIVGRVGNYKKGLPVLQEASLHKPLSDIRGDILKTAYASYWSELIYMWLEEGQKHQKLFQLFYYSLEALNSSQAAAAVLNVIFQVRFLSIAGLHPNFNNCSVCKLDIGQIEGNHFFFALREGGVVCHHCCASQSPNITLDKGTLKQLLWVNRGDFNQATRIRFAQHALHQAEVFLEQFVPFHIGKKPKSLEFLCQIRSQPL
jgi:DNA repair protein RecO (recombination protein O)